MTESISHSHSSKQLEPASENDAAVVNGDTSEIKTLNTLYADHASALTRHLRGAFGNGPPDPEDITQEAFARLAQRDHFTEIKNPRAFIWRMARNLMLSAMRKQSVRTKYDFEIEHLFFAVPGSEMSPERVLEVKEQLNIINEVIADMPEKRRLAFLMRRVDGLTFAAIGRQLNMSSNGVMKHVGRAVRDIQIAIEDTAEHD